MLACTDLSTLRGPRNGAAMACPPRCICQRCQWRADDAQTARWSLPLENPGVPEQPEEVGRIVVELSNNSAAEEEQMSVDFMITYGSVSYICELGTRRKDAGHVIVEHSQAEADTLTDQLTYARMSWRG